MKLFGRNCPVAKHAILDGLKILEASGHALDAAVAEGLREDMNVGPKRTTQVLASHPDFRWPARFRNADHVRQTLRDRYIRLVQLRPPAGSEFARSAVNKNNLVDRKMLRGSSCGKLRQFLDITKLLRVGVVKAWWEDLNGKDPPFYDLCKIAHDGRIDGKELTGDQQREIVVRLLDWAKDELRPDYHPIWLTPFPDDPGLAGGIEAELARIGLIPEDNYLAELWHDPSRLHAAGALFARPGPMDGGHPGVWHHPLTAASIFGLPCGFGVDLRTSWPTGEDPAPEMIAINMPSLWPEAFTLASQRVHASSRKRGEAICRFVTPGVPDFAKVRAEHRTRF